MTIKVHSLITGPFQENAFLVEETGTKTGLFIDPGDDAERLVKLVYQLDVSPLAIINSHAHLDHIGAVEELKAHYKIPFYLHPLEKPILDSVEYSYQMFGLPSRKTPAVDQWLKVDNPLVIGKFNIICIATPGHTPGGVCFRIDQHVFCGDTLFHGSIGRTDLPGGNWSDLEDSLVRLFKQLQPGDQIHCGHGPDTDLGMELSGNPFIRPLQNRIAQTDSKPI